MGKFEDFLAFDRVLLDRLVVLPEENVAIADTGKSASLLALTLPVYVNQFSYRPLKLDHDLG